MCDSDGTYRGTLSGGVISCSWRVRQYDIFEQPYLAPLSQVAVQPLEIPTPNGGLSMVPTSYSQTNQKPLLKHPERSLPLASHPLSLNLPNGFSSFHQKVLTFPLQGVAGVTCHWIETYFLYDSHLGREWPLWHMHFRICAHRYLK